MGLPDAVPPKAVKSNITGKVVAGIAAGQHGVVTDRQLKSAGVSPSTVSDWTRGGRLHRVQPRVYVVAGSPPTFERAAVAALLSAGEGAALSHRAAAWAWGLLEDVPPVELSVPRGRRLDLVDAVVHQTRDAFEIQHRAGFPVTSPVRSLVDLGAVVSSRVVEQALEAGLVSRLISLPGVEWQLAELSRQGRRGCGALKLVLDRRALGRDRPEGMLEPRFARLCARAGLPRPAYQHRVGRYRLDFAYPELKIAIEVDDFWSHGTLDGFQRDRTRQNELVRAGWTVLRFTWADIVKRPGYVAEMVASAIGAAQSGISD